MNTEVQSNETWQQEAYTLVQRYMQCLLEKDIERWISLWDEKGVLEFPFAPQGHPSRIEGKGALSANIQNVFNACDFFGDPQQQLVHLTLDPDLIIVEITGEGRIIATGQTCSAKYVWVMRTKQGKLIHVRDYWDRCERFHTRWPLSPEFANGLGFSQRPARADGGVPTLPA